MLIDQGISKSIRTRSKSQFTDNLDEYIVWKRKNLKV